MADILTLEELKNGVWEGIKLQRSLREYSFFQWDGSLFDSDAPSQSRIQGVVQLAQIALSQGQPFAVDWTLADNSVRTLTGQDVIEVGLALTNHITSCHARGRQLRAALDAAQTSAEVQAVQWYWP